MGLRKLMETDMLYHIGDPTNCSRYGRFFYFPKVEYTKRERRFNRQAKEENKIDLTRITLLSDIDFLAAYQTYQRRYNTWM